MQFCFVRHIFWFRDRDNVFRIFNILETNKSLNLELCNEQVPSHTLYYILIGTQKYDFIKAYNSIATSKYLSVFIYIQMVWVCTFCLQFCTDALLELLWLHKLYNVWLCIAYVLISVFIYCILTDFIIVDFSLRHEKNYFILYLQICCWKRFDMIFFWMEFKSFRKKILWLTE